MSLGGINMWQPSVKEVITTNPDWDDTTTKDFIKTVRKNGGFCPCKVKTQDNKCMCKEFREQEETGLCYCGLYYKEVH